MLREHGEGHAKLASILIEKEIIYSDDLELIFGKRKWISRSQEIFENKSSEESEAAETEKTGSSFSKKYPEDDLKKEQKEEQKEEQNTVPTENKSDSN
jgi:cell division protease FtsH